MIKRSACITWLMHWPLSHENRYSGHVSPVSQSSSSLALLQSDLPSQTWHNKHFSLILSIISSHLLSQHTLSWWTFPPPSWTISSYLINHWWYQYQQQWWMHGLLNWSSWHCRSKSLCSVLSRIVSVSCDCWCVLISWCLIFTSLWWSRLEHCGLEWGYDQVKLCLPVSLVMTCVHGFIEDDFYS